jgi:hypothetical protein
VLGQDLGVAGVGGRAVEGHRCDGAAAHVLAQEAVLPVGQAGAVLVVGQEEVPEAVRLCLLAHLDDDLGVRHARPHLLVERVQRLGLDRQDVVVHELTDALAQLLDAVGRAEVHGRSSYRCVPGREAGA